MSAPGNTDTAPTPGAQLYEARKHANLCTRCGKEPQSEDCLLGRKCRKKMNKWISRSAKRRRKRWAKQGRCTRCGGRKLRTGPLAGSCPRCSVELGKLKLGNVKQYVKQASDRPRDAAWAARTESDGYQRERYHGRGRRGRQSTKQLDEQDLVAIATHVAPGVLGLVEFHTAEVQALPRADREALRQDALAELARCGRWIEEVLARHRYSRPTVEEDEA